MKTKKQKKNEYIATLCDQIAGGKGKSTIAEKVRAAVPCSAWRKHPMMAVAGCIDSNGSISGRATKSVEVHRASESRGKRWRWIIHRQEFHSLIPKTLEEINNPRMNVLTDEEHFAVCDWLIRHGYADESILPND